MVIVFVCALLLSVGVFAIVRWGATEVSPPPAPVTAGASETGLVLRRYVWSLSLALWTVASTAVFVVGPTARLAMRLLAVTAGTQAQGMETEAGEIVGRITVGGTIGIFVFIGLFAGFVSTLTYLVLRRWLPAGRLGGLTVGMILLVVAGASVEPLRANNPDFDLVGPGVLSIVVFCAVVILQGMAVTAFAARLSGWLPLPAGSLRALLPHLILLLLIPGVVVLAGAVLLGGICLVLSHTRAAELMRSKQVLIAGRVVIAAGVLIALPGFVGAVTDIAGRGP
jgi:hypothetical protein